MAQLAGLEDGDFLWPEANRVLDAPSPIALAEVS